VPHDSPLNRWQSGRASFEGAFVTVERFDRDIQSNESPAKEKSQATISAISRSSATCSATRRRRTMRPFAFESALICSASSRHAHRAGVQRRRRDEPDRVQPAGHDNAGTVHLHR
jgi:hypothetical protein